MKCSSAASLLHPALRTKPVINSFFLEFCIQVLDLIEDRTFSKSDIDFNSLFSKFKNNKKKLYNNLDEKNKKRIKNRLYNFCEELKSIFENK